MILGVRGYMLDVLPFPAVGSLLKRMFLDPAQRNGLTRRAQSKVDSDSPQMKTPSARSHGNQGLKPQPRMSWSPQDHPLHIGPTWTWRRSDILCRQASPGPTGHSRASVCMQRWPASLLGRHSSWPSPPSSACVAFSKGP